MVQKHRRSQYFTSCYFLFLSLLLLFPGMIPTPARWSGGGRYVVWTDSKDVCAWCIIIIMSCSDPSASVTEVGLTLVLYLVINGGWWFEQINRHRERKRAEEARYHSNIEIVTCMCPPVSTVRAYWAVHMKSEWKERAREREGSLTSAQPPPPFIRCRKGEVRRAYEHVTYSHPTV